MGRRLRSLQVSGRWLAEASQRPGGPSNRQAAWEMAGKCGLVRFRNRQPKQPELLKELLIDPPDLRPVAGGLASRAGRAAPWGSLRASGFRQAVYRPGAGAAELAWTSLAHKASSKRTMSSFAKIGALSPRIKPPPGILPGLTAMPWAKGM